MNLYGDTGSMIDVTSLCLIDNDNITCASTPVDHFS